MALKTCHECKKDVSDQAAACPHCGAPRSKSPNNPTTQKALSFVRIALRFFLYLFLAGSILLAIVGMYKDSRVVKLSAVDRLPEVTPEEMYYKADSECRGSPNAQSACAEREKIGRVFEAQGMCLEGPRIDSPNSDFSWQKCKFNNADADTYTAKLDNAANLPIKVNAQQLFFEYKANEVAADAKYKNRKIILIGYIKSIKKNFLDEPYLEIASGEAYSEINAVFPINSANLLLPLKKGYEVTILCIGKGMMVSTPMLRDCGPAPLEAPVKPPTSQPTGGPIGPYASETILPSFDCAKASSNAERLICSDAELATLDAELASLYSKAKAAASDKAAFNTETKSKWKQRESECGDKSCLVAWYTLRRGELQAWISNASTQ